MTEWWLQWWIGLFLIVCGFSMGRMGPAFSRSKIGYPLALFGLAMAFFSPEGLEVNELVASQTLNQTLYWAAPGLFGCYTLSRGAPIYNVAKPAYLFAGWSIVALSWYIMATFSDPLSHDMIPSLVTILGLFLVFIIHIMVVRVVETLPQSEETVEPLSESEKNYVTTVLTRNLGKLGDE
ncbi:MAG: hypothetical protein CMB53_04045 [Euryarchaeota archaeon]|nr:hypothetical protein [Euryarchaeota archaeon]